MQPRDFLSDNNEMTPSSFNHEIEPRDFLQQNKIPEESFGKSLYFAPARIQEDLVKGAYNFAKNVPHYLEEAKTEIPGLINILANPSKVNLSNFKQAAAGLTELGHNALNFPSEVGQYLSNRLNLLPKTIAEQIPYQRDISKEINQAFGEPSQPGEKLIRGAVRNLPAVTGVAELANFPASIIEGSLTHVNPRKVSKSIQKSHDVLEGKAKDIFTNVGKEAVKRNVDVVPVRQNLIADIADHPLMPKSEKMSDILNKAHSGDYEGLRNLQSEMWQRATKANKSPLVSESNAADSLFELRDEINNSIKNNFINTGHADLANELTKGIGYYKKLMDTYFHKKTPAAIKNLVHPESRKIPKNIMNVLSEESIPMERVKSENPFAANNLLKHEIKQKALNNLKLLGKSTVGLGALGGLLYGGKSIYDLIKNRKHE